MATSQARLRIQRFEVMGKLGSGAMGAVYRARDPHLGRDVAIKVLARPAAEASGLLSLHRTLDLRGAVPAGELLAEAQVMARLSHPNLLPVYEVGLADDELFVVMEYIAGSDLRSWLAQPRSARKILDVFAQAARGLAAAHQHGIVHGDFKPENVLLGDDGRVRVADFGLSRLTSQATAPIRVEGVVGGTPYYMAPELWRGEAPTVQSDVFALSTAVAEALGGEAADRARLDGALRARRIGRRLRAAIAAGLADDPEARPKLQDLVACLTAGAAARRRWPVLVIAAAAVAGATALLATAGDVECEADRVRFAGRWDGERRAALQAKGHAAFVDGYRRELDDTLGAVCAAERRGELTPTLARRRTSCLERRAFELDAAAERLASEPEDSRGASHASRNIPDVDDCLQMEAPSLPVDRAPVVALYRRLVATWGQPMGSPQYSAQLAAIETEARALGERELESRTAVLLGMRQIETDELLAADASFARGYDLAIAINAPEIGIDALVERGIAAAKRGDPEAHAYHKLAYEVASKPTVSENSRLFATYGLARSHLNVGNPGQAIELVDKALPLVPPGKFLDRVMRQVKISALQQLGRHEKALELARATAELSRKALGERDPDYGTALNIIAWALLYTGDRVGALDYRRRALAVMGNSLPGDHSIIIFQRMMVASDLAANGQYAEATAEGSAVLALVDDNESARGARPEIVADLGIIAFRSGRLEEGLRQLEEGIDALISQSGQEHPDVLEYRLGRVDFELELGRLEDAERHMDALERSYRARSDQALALARLDGLYRAQLALARRDPRAAEARIRAALAGWRELHGSDAEREDLLRTLGASLVDQGRWKEALETLAAAEILSKARHGLEDRLALIDVERARALAGAGRVAEAEALARRTRDVLRRFPSNRRARVAIDELLARRKPR